MTKLDVTRMSAIIDQIAWLKQHEYEVILVSSGAMASGRGEMKVDKNWIVGTAAVVFGTWTGETHQPLLRPLP